MVENILPKGEFWLYEYLFSPKGDSELLLPYLKLNKLDLLESLGKVRHPYIEAYHQFVYFLDVRMTMRLGRGLVLGSNANLFRFSVRADIVFPRTCVGLCGTDDLGPC